MEQTTHTTRVKLKAVHRIECGEGRVIQPGESFQLEGGPEVERLLRLGAATLDVKGEDAARARGGE